MSASESSKRDGKDVDGRPEGKTADSGLSTLVDASRRISRLRDEDDIVRLAVREAISLTEAEVGAFVVVNDDGSNFFAFQSHPELFAASSVAGPALLDAVTEKRAECVVLEHEPAIGIDRIAAVAVPVMVRNELHGLLLAFREADRPFGQVALDTLGLLAPVVGSAIAAAGVTAPDEIDAETQLSNRRRLDRDFVEACRDGQVGFLSIRIDHIAEFTDAHGTEATQELVRHTALTLKSSIRPTDAAYRTADAEFAILLPGASKIQATWVAERIRQAITAISLNGIDSDPITASIGVTAGIHEDPQVLAEQARSAMLEAEELGCDRVITDRSR